MIILYYSWKLNAKVAIVTAYRNWKCDIEKTGINIFSAQQWKQLEEQGLDNINLQKEGLII